MLSEVPTKATCYLKYKKNIVIQTNSVHNMFFQSYFKDKDQGPKIKKEKKLKKSGSV